VAKGAVPLLPGPPAQFRAAQPVEPLPELAAVHWRRRVEARTLRRDATLWTLGTLAHTVPFIAAGALLMALQPLAFPVALLSLAHAWIIPALYAQRGANVLRPRPRTSVSSQAASDDHAERVAVGLLGDLVGHAARDLHAATGLVLERGALGAWLVGEAGAVLVRPGGRRVHCFCVRVKSRRAADGATGTVERALPASDRIAHLLLALRADECGFATVANLTFSGARWRVRRRLPVRMRAALDAARTAAA
jgi:hypothetical protein